MSTPGHGPDPSSPPGTARHEQSDPPEGRGAPDTWLMVETHRRVAVNRVPGVNTYSGWLADLRHGITLTGELRAVRSAGPFIDGLRRPDERSGAMRAAAIRVNHKDAVPSRQASLGASFARLAAVAGGSSIERQVGALPLLDLEAAAATLDGLVGRCPKAGIPVDFVDLARTLVAWGTGATIRSQSVRNQIVLDFYSLPRPAQR